MSDNAYKSGIKTRREVLGDAHVDRAEAAKSPFDQNFQRFITESAWGNVWHNDKLDRPTRSLITISLLATLGHYDEMAMHIRATRNTGATADQIAQALMHVAVYAGVPAANRAFAIAKETLAEMNQSSSS